MKWDEPAPTITGGFQTPGRGRFIHPKRKRVLTPHEASRIQGFPDWFDFISPLAEGPTRTMLGKWIGDAVPSILGAAAVLSAIG
jgi:DNA (cytosine-5)-methyltransferase 1